MVMRGPSRSRRVSLRVSVALQRSYKQSCLGTRLQGEALHCGKLRKITAKCLKIPLGLFLGQSSGQPAGVGFGVCFEGPLDAFQNAQLSDVS